MSKTESVQPAKPVDGGGSQLNRSEPSSTRKPETGNSISEVARRYGLAPSTMFQWRRAMDDATKKSLKANEKVVPESEVKKLKARIRELERALGKKSLQVEILEEAVEIAREKRLTSRGSSSDEGNEWLSPKRSGSHARA
jgi:transposase